MQFGCFVDPRDNHSYKTFTIGSQTWFAEDLSYVSPNTNDNISIIEGNKKIVFYNCTNLDNICPKGWHIPSNEEWKEFLSNINLHQDDDCDYPHAGKKLKSASSWDILVNEKKECGFSSCPIGCIENSIHIGDNELVGYWSSTDYDTEKKFLFKLIRTSSVLFMSKGGKNSYYSIRCVKDTEKWLKEKQAEESHRKEIYERNIKAERSSVFNTALHYGAFVDERDGRRYKTITIGAQEWMAENLAFKTHINSWAYNNLEDNLKRFGFLYDYESALAACPKGWHLPSEDEWKKMASYLGSIENDSKYLPRVGTFLKSSNSWVIDDQTIEGNNSSGFSALAAGCRSIHNEFINLGHYAYFWSSSILNGINQCFYLGKNFKSLRIDYTLGYAYSVRCVKD